MTNTFLQTALLRAKSRNKNKKMNGFTLIELMVVVAIVGILSGVGLPQLLKAQDKAKDSVAIATLTNAAKECSLILVTENGDGSSFDADAQAAYALGTDDDPIELGGTGCELDGDLTLESEGADGNEYIITFDGGGIPEPYDLVGEAAPGGTTPPAGGTTPPAGGTV